MLFTVMICWVTMGWCGWCGATEPESIATIKNVKGDVQIVRGEILIVAMAGADLLKSDRLMTGEDGAIGLIFKDNSVLSMGPESELAIEDFAFDPAAEKTSFVANMMKGTLTYLSGLITHLNPESVQFKTPSATIGIRGTHLAILVEG